MEIPIPVEGGTVWAEDTGGSGPAVVLLHPGIGDSSIWEPMLPLLGGYRVIRFDARGHGRSEPATVPYSLLGDLISVLDSLDVRRATFCGCSQGGAMSLDLALAQPARVGALVLVSPGVSGYDWPDDPSGDAAAQRCFEAGDADGLARLALDMWAAGTSDEASVAQVRSAVKAWLANGDFEQEKPPALGRLGEIAVPSVLLIGDKDYPPLIDLDMKIVAQLPGCELIDVPGGDHLLPLRVPGLIADQVRRFTPAG